MASTKLMPINTSLNMTEGRLSAARLALGSSCNPRKHHDRCGTAPLPFHTSVRITEPNVPPTLTATSKPPRVCLVKAESVVAQFGNQCLLSDSLGNPHRDIAHCSVLGAKETMIGKRITIVSQGR